MKKEFKLLCGLLSITCIATMAGCTDDSEITTITTTPATLRKEDQEVIAEIATSSEAKELENKKISWFCFWEMNPPEGDPARTSLEIFKSKYGGEIEDILCSYDERNTKLATLIAADQSPDLISGADLFPSYIIKGICSPVDEYIDFNNEIWNDVSEINQKYQINGKTYWPIFSTGEAGYTMIYNKLTVEENQLDDPAKLYESGEWTWDKFYEMGIKFLDNGEGRHVTSGWWFEEALIATTGVPAVDYVNGKLINNLNSPELQRVEEFLSECNKQGFAITEDAPKGVLNGTTLFYPVGSYIMLGVDHRNFGESEEDIMFVPMPRDPKADAHYVSVSPEVYCIASGAKNPEGAAAFIECARMATVDTEAIAIRQKQIMTDYKWTDEMYNMLLSMQENEMKNGIFDLSKKMPQDVSEAIQNAITTVYRNGDSWTQAREEIKGLVDTSIEDINSYINDMK